MKFSTLMTVIVAFVLICAVAPFVEKAFGSDISKASSYSNSISHMSKDGMNYKSGMAEAKSNFASMGISLGG